MIGFLKIVLPGALALSIGGCVAAGYPVPRYSGHGVFESSYVKVVDFLPFGYGSVYRPYRGHRHYYPRYRGRAGYHHGTGHRSHESPHRAEGYKRPAPRVGHRGNKRRPVRHAPRGVARRHDGGPQRRAHRARKATASHGQGVRPERATPRRKTRQARQQDVQRFRSPGESGAAFIRRYDKAQREVAREGVRLDRLLAEGAVPEK